MASYRRKQCEVDLTQDSPFKIDIPELDPRVFHGSKLEMYQIVAVFLGLLAAGVAVVFVTDLSNMFLRYATASACLIAAFCWRSVAILEQNRRRDYMRLCILSSALRETGVKEIRSVGVRP